MSISQDRMEKALTFLAESDEDYARSRALADGLKENLKIKKSSLFLKFTGAQGEREHRATAHPEYAFEVGRWQGAVQSFETLRAKRNTETMVIECWRSLNAARNRVANV